MTVRSGVENMTKRAGAVTAALAMMAGGVVLTAGPAAAAKVPCPPATTPPSANTWYGPQGDYRGTRILSRENYPNNRVAIQSWVVYETFGDGFHQKETWDLRRHWTDKRMDCERTEEPKPQDPKPQAPPPSGGGGSSRGGLGGPVGTPFVTVMEETRYGTVGEVQPM